MIKLFDGSLDRASGNLKHLLQVLNRQRIILHQKLHQQEK